MDLLPTTQFVTVKKLKANLLPASSNADENSGRGLVLQTYSLDQYWACTGAAGVATHYLACLRNQAKVAVNWEALFDGEKCLFYEHFHQILSAFALHNMRESDKGMEMMIANTIKGIADEVEFPLSREALAKGFPSKKTTYKHNLMLFLVKSPTPSPEDIPNGNYKQLRSGKGNAAHQQTTTFIHDNSHGDSPKDRPRNI